MRSLGFRQSSLILVRYATITPIPDISGLVGREVPAESRTLGSHRDVYESEPWGRELGILGEAHCAGSF